jgi:hypothetical protein
MTSAKMLKKAGYQYSAGLCSLEKGQRLFGNILLQIGITVKPDALVLRAVFHAAVALFGDTVHQLGYDFQVVDFTNYVYFFHD